MSEKDRDHPKNIEEQQRDLPPRAVIRPTMRDIELAWARHEKQDPIDKILQRHRQRLCAANPILISRKAKFN